MKVLFDGGLLEEIGSKKSAEIVVLLLKALVECNLAYLEAHPNTPHPYSAGIRYQRERKGHERWKAIPKILEDGEGDCEDLAAYLAAYLAHQKLSPVRIVVRWRTLPTHARLFHVLVKGPDGYEDPSRRLGM